MSTRPECSSKCRLVLDNAVLTRRSPEMVLYATFGPPAKPAIKHRAYVEAFGMVRWRWGCACHEYGMPTRSIVEAAEDALLHETDPDLLRRLSPRIRWRNKILGPKKMEAGAP